MLAVSLFLFVYSFLCKRGNEMEVQKRPNEVEMNQIHYTKLEDKCLETFAFERVQVVRKGGKYRGKHGIPEFIKME